MRLHPLITTLLLSSCDQATSPDASARLTLSSEKQALVPGETTQLTLTAIIDGQIASASAAVFSSMAPAVVSVSSDGRLTAIAPGTAVVKASLRTVAATLDITVQQGGILSPAGGTISTAGGALSVTAPAGAVAVETPVVLRALSVAPFVDPTIVRGAIYAIEMAGGGFAKPVSVRARYDVASAPYGLPQSALGLRILSSTSESWTDIRPSAVDSINQFVVASISRPSIVSIGRLVPTSPCTLPEHRAFDFWVGSWNITDGMQPAGENFITIEPGGCAILENYITPTSLSPGRSISFYNDAEHRWYQTYIDAGSNSVRLASTSFLNQHIPMVSLPVNNRFTRVTWTLLADGKVRQFVEETGNNGASFITAYDLRYTRK